MKTFIKSNKISILSFTLLALWGLYNIYICYKEGLTLYEHDPILIFYHIMQDLNLNFLQILAPLFVIVPSIWHFHSELHSGSIKNSLTRTTYKDYIRKSYKRALKSSIMLPLFVIGLMLMCCLLSGGFYFGRGKELYGWLSSPSPKYLNNIGIFMLIYLFNIFLHSILYINLGLIYCKKNHNILVAIIFSYLTFILIDIIAEIFVGGIILAKILNIHNIAQTLNLFNIWIYDSVISLLATVIYSITLVSISTLILYNKYKDKEKVINEIEKQL